MIELPSNLSMAILTVMRIDLSWADLIGGRLALDFVNTKGDRLTDAPNEHLPDYASFLAWAHHAGAVDGATPAASATKPPPLPGPPPRPSTRPSRYARRSTGMITERGRAPSAADVTRVNEAFARASADPHLTFHDSHYEIGWRCSDDLTGPLDAIVRDAVHLLAAPDESARVRSCESDSGCGWIFLDTTKSRTRRWCDMKVCGNRAKARRHYARRKTEE